VTGVDSANIRLRIMRIHLSFKTIHEEYERFKGFANDSKLLFGIDDIVMFGDDKAFDLARSICAEVLASKRPDDDAIFTFI